MTVKIKDLKPCILDSMKKHDFFSKYKLKSSYHFNLEDEFIIPSMKTFFKSVKYENENENENENDYHNNQFDSIDELKSAYLSNCRYLLREYSFFKNRSLFYFLFDHLLRLFNKKSFLYIEHIKNVDIYNYFYKFVNDNDFQESEFSNLLSYLVKKDGKDIEYLKLPFDKSQSFFVLTINNLQHLKSGCAPFTIQEYLISDIVYHCPFYDNTNVFKPTVFLKPHNQRKNVLCYENVSLVCYFDKNNLNNVHLVSDASCYQIFTTKEAAKERYLSFFADIKMFV